MINGVRGDRIPSNWEEERDPGNTKTTFLEISQKTKSKNIDGFLGDE